MSYNVDWNAIGSIATAASFIIAFISILVVNHHHKQDHKFQLAAIKQEKDEKKLDEIGDNILYILSSINHLDVYNYTTKLKKGEFTDGDLRQIESIAIQDELLNTKLLLQTIRLRNHEGFKPLLDNIEKMRLAFGDWLKIISPLVHLLNNDVETSEEGRQNAFQSLIHDMIEKCKESDNSREKEISYILESNFKIEEKTIEILCILQDVVTDKIMHYKREAQNALCDFVYKEHLRIQESIH